MLLGWYLSFSGSSLAVASACEFLDRGDSLLGRFAVLCLLAAVCLLLLAAVCLLLLAALYLLLLAASCLWPLLQVYVLSVL